MSEPIVFKNGFLIDGNGGEPVADGTLVVLGNRIEEVLFFHFRKIGNKKVSRFQTVK